MDQREKCHVPNYSAESSGRSSSLEETDWNFDSVPDEELNVSCLWEYGRESAFLRSIRERSAEAIRRKLPFRKRLDFVDSDFRTAFTVLGRSACIFQEGIYQLGGDKGHPNAVSRFPEPWQLLTNSERLILLETAAWNGRERCGLPGFRRSHPARAKELFEIFHQKTFTEVFGSEHPIGAHEFFHAGHKLRSLCPCYMSPSGQEVLLVEIDWGDFTNEELIKEFAQWLKENRPPGISGPDGRGHKKVSDRVKLERLGIMRLLHQFTRSELMTACPAAWKRYNSQNRRWSRDCMSAAAHFRELFPFLPEKEVPRSWPPKGSDVR